MIKKFKILHISHTDIRYDSRILKEIKALDNCEKYEIKAFSIHDDEGHNYDINNNLDIISYTIQTKKILKKIPRPIRYPIFFVESTIKLLIPAIRFKPKIVHCHDALFLPIAFLIKIFTNAKLVYDAHELESNKAGQTKALKQFTLIIEKMAWSRVDLLITVSPSIIKWYNEFFGVKKSLLILNSPSLSSESSQNEKSNYLHEKFNIPETEKIFLYLGIVGDGRGVEFYLDVFQKEDITSHVVFMGYGKYADKISALSKTCSKIHYHPAVPHDHVVQLCQSADVGLCMIENVSLSDYYCLPNKLFEYAFSGLFVLSSDFPDMQQVVKEYFLGECAKLDLESICQAIRDIEVMEIKNNDKDLYPLSWEYQAEKLVDAYNLLLS